MTPVAWVALAVALLAAFAVGMLSAFSWNKETTRKAMEALADRPRLLSMLCITERQVSSLKVEIEDEINLRHRWVTLNQQLIDANAALRERLSQTAWAVHAWRTKTERGQA